MTEVEAGDIAASPRKKSGLSLEEFYEEFQTLVKEPEDRVSILTGRSHKSGKSEGRQISGGDEAAKMAEQVSPDDVGSLVDSPDVITGDNGVKFEIQERKVYKEVVTKYEELIEEEEEYDDRRIRAADDDEVEKELKTKLTEKEGEKIEIDWTKTETEVITKERESKTESSGEKITESGGEKRTEGSWRTKTEVSLETKTERSSGEKRTESGGGEKRTESGGERRTESGGERRTESGGEKSTEGSWRTKTEVRWETKTEKSGGEERTESGGGEKRTEGSWGTKTEVSVETKTKVSVETKKSVGEKSGGGGQKEEKTESEKCHQCNLMESSWGKRTESGGEGGRKEEGTTRDGECEDEHDECWCTPMEIVIDDRSTYNEHDTAEPYPDDLFRVLIERERHFEEEEEEEDERQRKMREFSCQPKVPKKRRKKKRKKRLETTSEKRRRESAERRRRNKEAVEAWIRKKNIERKKAREIERKKNQEDEKQCVMLKLMRNPQLAYQAFLRAKNLERLKNYPKSLTITCESFEIWLQRCFKRRYNMESFMNW